jgi:hypothetical protein
MTEKLTCGRLSTCELCSRCLLHLPLRRTVVCVHICYTPHVCTLRDRCKPNYASYTVRLKGRSTASALAIVHFGSVGRLWGLFERSKAT